MIVEFMGCSGAGKTTLATGVAQRLRDAAVPVHQDRAAAGSVRSTLANALRTPYQALPVFSDARYRRHWEVTWRLMRGRASNSMWRVARGYAAGRIVGTHARRVARDRGSVQIVDEGLLVTAQLAFAGPVPTREAEVDEFVQALTLPDLLVWVDAPPDVLVQRTLARTDPPRELQRLSIDHLRETLTNVRHAYASIARAQKVQHRVLEVENGAQPSDCSPVIDELAQRIRVRAESWLG